MRKPYVILIGSASGIGKSTIAAELAKKLNIKHLIESDFIRAVVRGIIGKEYAPALHSSSYDAYKHLRNKNRYEDYGDLVSAGFDEHASYVIPALEKIIQRAITDYDDIIIEGVHLVPGLIDIEQFRDYANIYFFILSSDEESHKERFVKRAIQIQRGGKQLDFFKENRIIHDHLLKQAEKNNVDIIKSETIEKTLDNILSIINKACTTIKLTNTVDELEDVINIIIKQNNGSLEKVTYQIPGFKEPLVRNINVSDVNSAEKFIKNINENNDKKEYLSKLYDLSDYRNTVICASNQEKIDEIIEELKNKGYVLNE
ncbi:3H domain-containing protein [Methanobrevibacter sp.]|uniref:3H domain-containing protein n=1 Tax=Methanobrevibacter sp. TaxID=66852 RepID=UPI0026E0BD17|nr:3H domain-containing protein [Methanobrevibacter sp.]MDO5860648.1 3H domain-containing protein [Methanobrevibacter sp.]